MDEHESYMQDEHIERPTYGFTYEWTMNVFYEKKSSGSKIDMFIWSEKWSSYVKALFQVFKQLACI